MHCVHQRGVLVFPGGDHVHIRFQPRARGPVWILAAGAAVHGEILRADLQQAAVVVEPDGGGAIESVVHLLAGHRPRMAEFIGAAIVEPLDAGAPHAHHHALHGYAGLLLSLTHGGANASGERRGVGQTVPAPARRTYLSVAQVPQAPVIHQANDAARVAAPRIQTGNVQRLAGHYWRPPPGVCETAMIWSSMRRSSSATAGSRRRMFGNWSTNVCMRLAKLRSPRLSSTV